MKEAFVTLICGGDAYVPGVEALGESLRATGTERARVVMVTEDVSPSARMLLEGQGWEIRPVDPIANPNVAQARLFRRFGPVYTKLRVWTLTDLDKVVYMDADTLVLSNVDDLFDRPGLAAAPDFFLPDHFNAGVLVVEPNQATFDRMMTALPVTHSYDGGDQGFLNTFLGDWWESGAEHRLPAGYNFHNFIYEFMLRNEPLWRAVGSQVKIVHYTLHKPWLKAVPLAGGVQMWWKTYERLHPEGASPLRTRLHEASDWVFQQVVDTLTH